MAIVHKILSIMPVANGVGEGPAWDASLKSLLWADITGRTVHRLNVETGEVEIWRGLDFPCFAVPTQSGGLLVGLRDGVYWLDPTTGDTSPLVRPEAQTRPTNRSNEGKVDYLGRLWFGTMESNLDVDGTERLVTQSSGALYCVASDGECTKVVDGVGLSNTLAWTPDLKTMYFGDSRSNAITRFGLSTDFPRVISEVPFQVHQPPGVCDGSAIDSDGRLWNARFGASSLACFSPDGRVEGLIHLPVTNPTSCCFGGADLKTLYVTSARFGLTAGQLSANPIEGALIAISVDATGTVIPPFAG